MRIVPLCCRSQSIELFSRPAVHTAISGLMAEMPSAPGLSARLPSRFQDNTDVLLQQFLDKAAAEGPAADGVDARLFLDRRLAGINCFRAAALRHRCQNR